MFGFEGLQGLAVVVVVMLVIFVLYCTIGSKKADNQQENSQDMPQEFLADTVDNAKEYIPKNHSRQVEEFEEDIWSELDVAEPPQPQFASTFMPEQPSHKEFVKATSGGDNDLHLEMDEATLAGIGEIGQIPPEAKHNPRYINDETLLLSREVLENAQINNPPPVQDQEPEITIDQELFDLGASTNVLIPEAPLAFGYNMAWVAIPNVKSSEVLNDLNIRDIKPANWTKGLTTAYEDKNLVFVTPNLKNWVLVIGRSLWSRVDLAMPVQKNSWLNEISSIYEEAYFFTTMRVIENHGWVRIKNGVIDRSYGYSGEIGEVVWSLGNPTPEELSIDANFMHEGSNGGKIVIPDEKDVLRIAAAWTVDTSFVNANYGIDIGFVGKL